MDLLGIVKDQAGNISSFRIVWIITCLTIVLKWALSPELASGAMQAWPLDGTTTIALFVAPAAKTFSENGKK